MKRFAAAVSLSLIASGSVARADDAAPVGCSVGSTYILSQDKPDAKGDVTINCSGLTEAFGNQLADVLTRILQNRLDPQMVLAKLSEVNSVPEEGVARVLDENQRQAIIQSLAGKPAAEVGITAHPAVDDSAEYAKAIAAPLLMVGWQIEGHQIQRTAPKLLEPVSGVGVVVRDTKAAPQKALQLQAALAAAHISATLLANPALAPEATVLWIGRRPVFMSPDAPK
jgi:hypothetical protein